METVGAAVIGAGVVGLACARALAQCGIDTLVVERRNTFGSETSSRNSEVIHAGIHGPEGSLKTQLCVAGRRALYDYCASHAVGHRRCGKLIVATAQGQQARLEALLAQGRANGVDDLCLLDADEARRLEPELSCAAAVLSPSTGIVDSHGLMLSLLGDAQSAGALLAVNSPVTRGWIEAPGFVLETGGTTGLRFRADRVVNAAGLWAPQVAASLAGFPAERLPASHQAKGNYYTLAGRSPFSRLVYPLPQPGGLGVHLTLDLAGQARFGPDVEWLPRPVPGGPAGEPDYRVDPARADAFYAEIRRYWPALRDGSLAPAYSGIRPKIAGPDDPPADFLIQGPRDHGVPGLVNLFGIESPGLTACLAIARHVAGIIDG